MDEQKLLKIGTESGVSDATKVIKNMCKMVYSYKGERGVYELMDVLNWKQWRMCDKCKSTTPHMASECLVCANR